MKRTDLMKKMNFILFAIACNTMMMAQTDTLSIEAFTEQYKPLQQSLSKSFESKDYQSGEAAVNNLIALFTRLSKADQQQYQQIQANNYYNLACFYALQNKKKQAVDAFEKCVKDFEYVDYAHAKTDSDLDNIRKDKRFVELLASIREKGDYKHILQQAGGYASADTTGLPHFYYEKATNARLQDVKKYFNLDSVAGQGDEISKIINLMTFVHDAIEHSGSNYALCEFDAIDFYNYYKATGKGINCRGMAMTLNEYYLAMGFKSRFITCMPKDRQDPDCHVINCVYSTTLKKWLWMDPSFNAYVKDENGNLLSIEEVRERLIANQPLVLNADANHNNREKQTKAYYLETYMAKNLYFFQCNFNSEFNAESRYRKTQEQDVQLLPVGLIESRTDKPGIVYISKTQVIVNDPAYFWQEP